MQSQKWGKAMVLNISFKQQEKHSISGNFSLKKFCSLHVKQLIYHHQIDCARIVYYDSNLQKHQEVVDYRESKFQYSPLNLAYLKSESWMDNYPHVFDIHEFQLVELPNYHCYVCVIEYKNYLPEYIQIITDEKISTELQNYLQDSARILSQYIETFSDNLSQKSKIQLLEHTVHKAAHQLRNYLSLIGLYAHNLYLRLPDNDYCQQQAAVIHENVQKLDFNLTDILSCGQGVKLNRASHDLKEIVAESIKNFQPIISQKNIEINLPETSVGLLLDKLQIQQVFDNLIINAIHFSPEFGKIVINWQIFHEEILIKICDSGPGIAAEDIQKIFNPFYSHRQGGTGLGLTIAKKIVLDHSGSLWAQNSAQGGAIFSMILPRK